MCRSLFSFYVRIGCKHIPIWHKKMTRHYNLVITSTTNLSFSDVCGKPPFL